MQTLYRLFDVSQIATAESEIIAFVNGEVNDCIEKGDVLGAGEWLASRLDCAGSDGIDGVMAKNIALWASPSELGFSPASMDDLLANLSAFDSELLSIALISLVARRPKHVLKTPGLYRDLAFIANEAGFLRASVSISSFLCRGPVAVSTQGNPHKRACLSVAVRAIDRPLSIAGSMRPIRLRYDV
jgi:hypothetical protein